MRSYRESQIKPVLVLGVNWLFACTFAVGWQLEQFAEEYAEAGSAGGSPALSAKRAPFGKAKGNLL